MENDPLSPGRGRSYESTRRSVQRLQEIPEEKPSRRWMKRRHSSEGSFIHITGTGTTSEDALECSRRAKGERGEASDGSTLQRLTPRWERAITATEEPKKDHLHSLSITAFVIEHVFNALVWGRRAKMLLDIHSHQKEVFKALGRVSCEKPQKVIPHSVYRWRRGEGRQPGDGGAAAGHRAVRGLPHHRLAARPLPRHLPPEIHRPQDEGVVPEEDEGLL
ncbi:hypothetical protein CEXT_187941 [Caerostris extrusa]|uniref:Uncharacterized protein n=1 Tax=Caerostris extrusa TaxID=172846 RepID=A0AAV4MM36_CAEEX|nr:hypothetical protein CEXT_187941 [Caerostris extrusa]